MLLVTPLHRMVQYGLGTYLATNSSKSDRYAEPNDAGEQCIFVVRTILGESHPESLQVGTPGYAQRREAVEQWRLPPERPDGRGPLSSVAAVTHQHGGAVDHPEYIVYERRQCLPQFAIWYTHQPDCFCLRCVTHKVLIKHPLSRSSFAVPAMYVQDPLGIPGQQILSSSAANIKHEIRTIRGMAESMQELLDVDGQPVAARGVIGAPIGGHTNGQSGFGRTLTLLRHDLGLLADGPAPLTIQLICPDQTTVPISLPSASAVGDLTELIQLNTGIPVERQRLIVAGAELGNRHDSLQAAGIVPNGRYLHECTPPPDPGPVELHLSKMCVVCAAPWSRRFA